MTIFIVTQGSYSDYRIRALFEDEESAQAYADSLSRRSKYLSDEVAVEYWDVMAPGSLPTILEFRNTVIDTVTGDVVSTETSTLDAYDEEDRGKAETSVRRDFKEVFVRTHGDSSRVPQTHSDAVAKLRAEIIGL